MARLGYTRYVAQGGDQGASVTDAMAHLAPNGLLGIHLNFLGLVPPNVLASAFGDAYILGKFRFGINAKKSPIELLPK